MEYYGGNPTRARAIRCDGKHENDSAIGKSVPLEVVEISSLNLAQKIAREGKLVQRLDLKIVGFGHGKLNLCAKICRTASSPPEEANGPISQKV
jgi:hypothetical protein